MTSLFAGYGNIRTNLLQNATSEKICTSHVDNTNNSLEKVFACVNTQLSIRNMLVCSNWINESIKFSNACILSIT